MAVAQRVKRAVRSVDVVARLGGDEFTVVLTEIDAEQSVATVRLAVNPMVLWLWLAVGVMVLGAGVAGWPRRRAVDVPDTVPAEGARPESVSERV